MSPNFHPQKKRLHVIVWLKSESTITRSLVLRSTEKHFMLISQGRNKNRGRSGRQSICNRWVWTQNIMSSRRQRNVPKKKDSSVNNKETRKNTVGSQKKPLKKKRKNNLVITTLNLVKSHNKSNKAHTNQRVTQTIKRQDMVRKN